MFHESMDGTRGRKPLCEVWTEQGWHYESTWAVAALPAGMPRRAQLIVHADQKTGTIALSLEGFEEEDGA
jgi:hypothetical protein